MKLWFASICFVDVDQLVLRKVGMFHIIKMLLPHKQQFFPSTNLGCANDAPFLTQKVKTLGNPIGA